MIAVELEEPCGELVAEALEAGILINVARDNVIRLLPALTMSDQEADALVSRVSGLIQR
jgi:acetylornithine aminotransferase